MIKVLSRPNTEKMLEDGEATRIELIVTNRYDFDKRLLRFLEQVANLSQIGASRTIGVTDDSEYKDVKIFIDGDGSDKIWEVTKVE